MKHAALWISLLILASNTLARESKPPLEGVRRVVFVGDSITYAGQWVEYLEAYLRVSNPGLKSEFLDIGLPSETVSGLSEPGHAGGQFPRPNLHERLGRVLEMAKPDLLVVCYGMNDGIYHPFGEERFARFREGIESVRKKASDAGAKVLHITPPVFDPNPIKKRTLPAGQNEYRSPYVGYDEVLDLYSAWLLAHRGVGWDVVDTHGPMERFLKLQRERDPDYHLAGDGVHMNAVGHWLAAREVLRHWGVDVPSLEAAPTGEEAVARFPQGPEVLKRVQRKQRLLKDAWLSATKHTRPGMKAGLPLDEATALAAEIEAEIRKLLEPRS